MWFCSNSSAIANEPSLPSGPLVRPQSSFSCFLETTRIASLTALCSLFHVWNWPGVFQQHFSQTTNWYCSWQQGHRLCFCFRRRWWRTPRTVKDEAFWKFLRLRRPRKLTFWRKLSTQRTDILCYVAAGRHTHTHAHTLTFTYGLTLSQGEAKQTMKKRSIWADRFSSTDKTKFWTGSFAKSGFRNLKKKRFLNWK